MSEKTEQPTAKKLRDARKKGQVAKSREIPSAAVLLGIFMTLWLFWGFYLTHFESLVLLPTRFYEQPFPRALKNVLHGILKEIAVLSLPTLSVAVILGVLGNFFQIGFLFAPESIKPEMKKLNPIEGLKKIFSLHNLIELLKSGIKITFLGMLLYLVIRQSVDPLLKIPFLGLPGVSFILAEVLKKMAVYTGAAFLIVAAVDYYLQQFQHTKKLKMTKDEVKREYKEMEGDPIIKGKRKQLHQEMAMHNAAEKARKSTVVITNPIHFAVAVYYDAEEGNLPVVVAKGENRLARRIVEIAREEGIPVMQNVPLARALYRRVEPDQYIPSELIAPVAEVLRWVAQWRKNPHGPEPPYEPG